MTSFKIGNKKISVFPSAEPNRPVVYLNTFEQEENQVLKILQNSDCPDFTLAAVSNLEWNHDMSPWNIPPVSSNGTPFNGGADDYLKILTDKIMPEAEKNIKGSPLWRGIAGYSLAGLFALYSIYKTDVFSRVASISGSLWFPGIKEYIFSHETKKKPDCIYFSLGDRENKTRNKFTKCVRQNTEEIETLYKSQGIDTVFRLNPGNHFNNSAKRSADGIAWILNK